ncbi:FMN-dependent NADH-azoreductase [Chitinophaga costaii]|uniref:FMN dependent NADH:quinone oxidoreductase n=1 Tax=Chitinophaga costaii TaxID=1335309 RepID=A0A1C4FXS8_9BACT|nr:NAD(P)H-dependent oxidoreductase [Chitinophaga costaii]PUZ20902.1 FMN-dependent NADH-azoreductase [Chitinophaga costaii]SCC60740.1 FMN-dependent NADH-azoreductase [Chitinophaga costaii]
MAKKVLRIISSPRGAASLSIQLGNAIVEKIKVAYPASIIKEINLANDPLPHLDGVTISSFFTPAEHLTPEQLAAITYSDKAIAALQEADIIVVDAPMYNFTITSTLKSFLDHIVRRGVTFQATENGIEGLLKNKKVYLAFSASGNYAEGPGQSLDFVIPLLKSIFGWLGMTDVTVFRAEGFRMSGITEADALQKGIDSIVIA